jgi:hypothetical protein
MTGLVSKGNTIAIPAGFNPRDPASVAAALAALPTNGRDVYSIGQSGGAGIIGPALEIERLEVSTGPSLVVVETLYALTLPAETFSLATGGVVEMVETDFEGEGADDMIIYYGETAPLTTLSGAAVTGSGIYSIIALNGVNTLTIPFSNSADSTSWSVGLTDESFQIIDSFTLEFFGRLGASLPSGETQYSFLLVSLFDDLEQTFESEILGFYYNFDDPFGGGAPNLYVQYYDANDFIEPDVSAEDAIAMRHFAVQLIGGNRVVVHFNGSVIYDEVKSYNVPASLAFSLYSFKVDGPALGQLRLSNTALYGADAFTPPGPLFFDDSE